MRKWIFRVTASLVGFVICFLAIPFILNPFVKDATPKDDSDIRPLTLNIPDADNAYFDLQKAAELYATNTNIADKNTALQLSKNAEVLKLFADASTKKYYQQPEYARPETISFQTKLPPLGQLRNIARLKKIEAIHVLEQGNVTEALNIALQSVKVGKLLQESQALPLATLVGVVVADTGHETIQQILADERVSTYNFAAGNSHIEKYEPDVKKRDLTFRAEYLEIASMLDAHNLFGEKGLIAKASHFIFWYKPVETHNMIVDLGRYWIAESQNCKNIDNRTNEPVPHQIEVAEKISTREWLFYPKLYFTPNALGDLAYNFGATGLGTQIKQCQSTLQARSLAVAFALHAYKQANGNFPASLDQLVPNYIESIPVDPFTELPPKYSAKDRSIYSETYESGKEKVTPLNLPTRIYHF